MSLDPSLLMVDDPLFRRGMLQIGHLLSKAGVGWVALPASNQLNRRSPPCRYGGVLTVDDEIKLDSGRKILGELREYMGNHLC